LRDIPVWAQAAAAMLLLGVAAGLANLQVTVGREGLSVRTGWSREVPVQSPSAVAVSHEDLRALERSLRTEIESRPVSSTVEVDAKVREEIMQGVRALLARQAQEQQREVSLQAAEVLRTVNAQRLSDNAKMAQILDAKDRAIQFDAWRQQQYVHALAQQVSLQGLK
jgi:hypothetical protein